ncbi:hypothetical protein ACGTN9_18610 [Halobacillus sp. MO56]
MPDKTYTDYVNRVAITLPDEYIDIKTGDSYAISEEIKEQLAYHAHNSTLVHLVFSALDHYFSSSGTKKNGDSDILKELASIKAMLQSGYTTKPEPRSIQHVLSARQKELDLREVDDVLEAFGG